MLKKMPPPEKIMEAWSALADGRVNLAPGAEKEAGEAAVKSSNGEKTYEISWTWPVFSSTDNASYWQGYPGYPVIAVLMKLGVLPYNAEYAQVFAGIDWHAANKAAHGDYAAALAKIMANTGLGHEKEEAIRIEATKAFDSLRELDIILKRPKRKSR